MMAMWAGAVENLRQRDTDIRHIREVGTVCELIQCHSLGDFDFFFKLQTRHTAPFGAEPQGRNLSSPSANLSQQSTTRYYGEPLPRCKRERFRALGRVSEPTRYVIGVGKRKPDPAPPTTPPSRHSATPLCHSFSYHTIYGFIRINSYSVLFISPGHLGFCFLSLITQRI